MMNKLLMLIFVSVCSFANIFDDININNANEYLNKGKYKEALDAYNKIDNKTDAINYNIGNILYKQKKYEEAISYYDKISPRDLKFKKLHNLGNTYAKLNKLSYAIKRYEQALKVKEDKDTRFNLDLLKKKQEEGKKAKNNKNKKENKDNKSKKDGSKSSKSQDSKKKKKEANGEKKKDIKEKKDNLSKLKDKNKKTKRDDVIKPEDYNTTQENVKNTDLSKLEMRKWDKMLNKRELNTLMIPLKNKGEKQNVQNINPW